MINIFRKKNKLTALLALTAAVLMLCTGCMRSGVGVIIEPDDTGTVEISMGINEKYIDSITEQFGGTDPFEGKDIATLTDGDNTYICFVEHKQFTSLDELKTILLELEYNFEALEGEDSTMDDAELDESLDFDLEFEDNAEEEDDVWISADGEEITVEGDETSDETADEENYKIFKTAEVTHESSFFGDTYHLSVTTMPHEMNTDDLAMLGISGDNFFKLVVAVTMPGTITAEGATITENTASFTITDLDEEQVLTVESVSTNVAGMIAVGIAVIVLIVILILVFSRKKPQQNRVFE